MSISFEKKKLGMLVAEKGQEHKGDIRNHKKLAEV